MTAARNAEIARNFDFFQTIVGDLSAEHAGRYALLHDRSVIGLFSSAGEAATEGFRRYQDGLFSVQRVMTAPVDLGFFSHVGGAGADR